MKMKKLLALALCLVLACSLLPTAALAREDEAEVSDWTELQQALSDGASVITLTDDITSTAPLTIGNGVTVTVDLNNHTLDRNLTSGVNNGCVIKVESGGSLTLTNGTVTGGFNKDCGGGIVNKGTLVLDTMTVTGNTSSKQGGGIYNEGVITANKTYITSNKSLSTSSDIDSIGGGGICSLGTDSQLRLTRVTVTGNTSAGNGGGISIYNYALKQTLDECIISENELTATSLRGGGIFVKTGSPDHRVVLTDCSITGNTSKSYGAGLAMKEGFVTANNCEITDNKITAGSQFGAGVYIEHMKSEFVMNGGVISGNKHTSGTVVGDGVYFDNLGKSGNGSIFIVSGDAKITGNGASGNSNVYIASNQNSGRPNPRLITVGGDLTDDARIGVSKNGNTGEFTTGLDGKGGLDNFFSDNGSYAVGINASREAYIGSPKTVTFSSGGFGEGEMDAVTVAQGSYYTLPACAFFDGADEWRFTNWQVGSDLYDEFDEITVNSDLTVTAIWDQVFDIAIDCDGNGTVIADPLKAVAGEPVTLTPEPGDHATLDTLTVKDMYGSDVAVDSDHLTFDMPEGGAGVTAMFKHVEYTVGYELYGGKNHPGNPAGYNNSDEITLQDPTRTGYNFLGWYDNEEFRGDPIEFLPHGSGSADLTLHAKWEANSYGISYSSTEHGSVSGQETASYEETVTLDVTPETGATHPYTLDTLTVTYVDGDGETCGVEVDMENYTFSMPAWPVTVEATFKVKAMTWAELQTALNESDTPITLYSDVTAEEDDGPLTVSTRVDYLDLNGHTISRSREDYEIDGYVIKVLPEGYLAVKDSSQAMTGKITGGKNAGDGGGVYVEAGGEFRLTGGSITGNETVKNGGGVYVEVGGGFDMYGGAITENDASGQGGGVYNAGGCCVSAGTISHNEANVGGGVCNIGTLYMERENDSVSIDITYNNAVGSGDNGIAGGGILSMGSVSSLSLYDVTISYNKAIKGHGGGICLYNYGVGQDILACTIKQNEVSDSKFKGGGMYVRTSDADTDVTLLESELIGNSIAGNYGAGLHLQAGVVSDEGSTIKNNKGCGVYVEGGTFTVEHLTEVTGNGKNASAIQNVYLKTGTSITIDDELSENASIGVTMETPGVFTAGLDGCGTAANFTSDSTSFVVGLSEDGEAMLGAPCTVAFDKGEGTGDDMEPATVAAGSVYKLPGCTFDAPAEGQTFAGWQLDDALYGEGDSYVVTGDVTFTATYETSSDEEWTIDDVYYGETIVVKYGDAELTEGEDYTAIFYQGDEQVTPETAGDYSAAITGMGDYEGISGTVTFSILRLSVTVTITGHTDEFYYDGEGEVFTVEGYDVETGNDLYTESDFTYSGDAEASGTGAGTYYMGLTANDFENTNSNFDVTFEVEDGWIKIKKLDVTVTITENGDEVDYDGEEHTVTGYDVEIYIDMYTEADFMFTGTASVSGTDAGTYDMELSAGDFVNTNPNFDVTFVIEDGQLVIYPLEVTVTITGKTDEVDYDGEEHTLEGFGWEADSELYTEADFEYFGYCFVGGTDVETYDMGLSAEDFENTNDNFIVTFEVEDGYLAINPLSVTVTITGHTDEVEYDGEEHTVEGYDVEISDPLYTAADFEYYGYCSVSGTDADTYPMGILVDEFNNLNDNFDVTFEVVDGCLTIYTNSEPATVTVTITEHSDEVDYDGVEHTVTGYDVEISDPRYTENDFTFSGDASVSGTDAGTYDMELSADNFMNTNVNFDNVVFVIMDGQLVIDPLEVTVTITEAGEEVDYDGEEHTVTGYDVESSDPLYTAADFTFSGDASVSGTDAGDYDMELSDSDFTNTNPNFDVTFVIVDGQLVIDPISVTVTITEHGDEVDYKGGEYVIVGYDVEIDNDMYTEADFTFTGNASVSGTDAGTYYMNLSADDFTNINENFTDVVFVIEDGQLVIDPIETLVTVTITEHSDELDYNGEEQTVEGYDVEISNPLYSVADFDFIGDDSVSSVSGTDAGTYYMNLSADYFININENFINVEFVIEDGQLEISPLSVTATVTGNNYEVSYDGEEHTVDGYILESDSDLYTDGYYVFSGDEDVRGTDAGTYYMNLSADDFENTNTNFDVTFVIGADGWLTITQRAVTIKANDQTVPTGGDIETGTDQVDVSEGSLVEGHVISAITLTAADGAITPSAAAISNGDEDVTANYDISYADGTVTYDEPVTEPTFRVQSVALGGLIAVNFFMDLPDIEGVNYADSYMEFTVNDVTSTADYNENFHDANGKGYYGFTCYVNSVQMAETIAAVFHYGSETVEKTYSVKEYMEAFDERREEFDAKTIAVFEAMTDYGHYAQPFLAQANHWFVGETYAEMDKCYTASYGAEALAAAQEGLENRGITRSNEAPDEIEAITYTLTLDSGTDLLVYFKPASGYSGNIAFEVTGSSNYTVTKTGGRYLVKISNIAAHLLGSTYTITATTDNATQAYVEVSAISYAKGLMDAYPDDEPTMNAAIALYNYYKAAYDYYN